jgi:nucleotide-binding universal stress UspA family protein
MTAPDVRLPGDDGSVTTYRMRGAVDWPAPSTPLTSRVALAAAHVVPEPLADNVPGAPAQLDWDATLAFRHHLWSYGLGVAEAMDTAQRGMGMDWPATLDLIKRSAAEAKTVGGTIAAGASTDQLPPQVSTVAEVIAAYTEQIAAVEDAGAQVVIMASRQLNRVAESADDFLEVYDQLLRQVRGPVILHWLGSAFDPALEGYWGSTDIPTATSTVLSLLHDHADRVDGVKVSLLEADHEIRLRAAMPDGVRTYTGDDFNYPELILGDGKHTSDALLGIFAAIAPAASSALQALDGGDQARYRSILEPTVPLSRHIFGAPTYYYKTGIAFLAWLSGHQPGFSMVGGLHSARSVAHLVELFRLADGAGLLPDPELAANRMRSFLDVSGVPR